MNELAEAIGIALVGLRPERIEDALRDLLPLYDEAMVFRDPVQEVRGKDAFEQMNRRLLKRMRRLEWEVRRTTASGDTIFLEWTMSGAPKIGPALSVDGVSRLSVGDGKILEHRDYWDLGELAASALPGGQRLLHALLKPFA